MAKVTSAFISSVKAGTWSSAGGGCIINPSTGAETFPSAATSSGHSNAWTLAAWGPNSYTITEPLAAAIAGGRALDSGEYEPSPGVIYWLGVSGGAVADLPGSPPPPPPP